MCSFLATVALSCVVYAFALSMHRERFVVLGVLKFQKTQKEFVVVSHAA